MKPALEGIFTLWKSGLLFELRGGIPAHYCFTLGLVPYGVAIGSPGYFFVYVSRRERGKKRGRKNPSLMAEPSRLSILTDNQHLGKEHHNQLAKSHQILLWSWGVGSAALKSMGCIEGRSLSKTCPSGKEERGDGDAYHALLGCPPTPVASLTTTRAWAPPRLVYRRPCTGHLHVEQRS